MHANARLTPRSRWTLVSRIQSGRPDPDHVHAQTEQCNDVLAQAAALARGHCPTARATTEHRPVTGAGLRRGS